MSTFTEGQKVRIVKGYVGVANAFCDGFTPTAGMEGVVESEPEPEESLDYDDEIIDQWVVVFGDDKDWDTFTEDELEAVE